MKRYYQAVLEHAWVLGLCVLVAVAAAGIYVAVTPKRYSAQAEMLIAPVTGGEATLISLPILHSSGDPTRDVLTASSLITTPQVAEAVAKALQLDESPGDLLDDVSATPVGQSNLVAVEANASSAQLAQRIANEFTRQVINTRGHALHQAIGAILPGLRLQIAGLPVGERNGPGTLGEQLSQLEQLDRSPDPTITLATAAGLPGGPSSPKVGLSLVAGLLGGLIVGLCAVLALHALDPRLRREEQLRELLRVPVLARIPREPTGRGRPLVPDELSFGALEGFKTLRTMLTARAGGAPRAYLLTGSSPAEGKTTSSIGLATALAQTGARVILIEADLRRPTISKALELPGIALGTEHVLRGEAELADALEQAPFAGVSLQVLAVRRPGAELADLLSMRVARELVEQARELADFVVIDSPPLTEVSDALPLAKVADEVLLVARIGTTRLGKLSDLYEMLSGQDARPAGIVLVGGSPARGEGYYYAEPSTSPPPLPSRGENGGDRWPHRVRGEEPLHSQRH
ncbi:MAG TPA: AAA family ATPase [Solirubrobacteraceae bacterium]